MRVQLVLMDHPVLRVRPLLTVLLLLLHVPASQDTMMMGPILPAFNVYMLARLAPAQQYVSHAQVPAIAHTFQIIVRVMEGIMTMVCIQNVPFVTIDV